MTKKNFEKIFKNGLGFKKIDYKDAENGESDLRCFECGTQAGLNTKSSGLWGRKKTKIKCINGHEESLINYTVKFAEMIEGVWLWRDKWVC